MKAIFCAEFCNADGPSKIDMLVNNTGTNGELRIHSALPHQSIPGIDVKYGAVARTAHSDLSEYK